MSNDFLRTTEGKNIIILEDRGYKRVETQRELTYPQELFLHYGYEWIDKEKEKQIKANAKRR